LTLSRNLLKFSFFLLLAQELLILAAILSLPRSHCEHSLSLRA
jgi:hypothetical protein